MNSESNPYESPSETNATNSTGIRAVVTTLAIVSLFVLGYLWIAAIAERNLIKVASSFVSLITIAPWSFHNSHVRDAASASISIFVGACGAILAIILYFQLFELDWFREAFNHKGTGPAGLLLFFGMGFFLGWLLTCRILIMMSFPTENFFQSQNKNRPQDSE